MSDDLLKDVKFSATYVMGLKEETGEWKTFSGSIPDIMEDIDLSKSIEEEKKTFDGLAKYSKSVIVFGERKLIARHFRTSITAEGETRYPSVGIFKTKEPVPVGTEGCAEEDVSESQALLIFKTKESLDTMISWLEAAKKMFDGLE
jgi:hypothetical protein